MDGKLPEISVLDSNCLMAGEFGILFTRAEILTSGNGYAVRALDLGLNPEASRAFGDLVGITGTKRVAFLSQRKRLQGGAFWC